MADHPPERVAAVGEELGHPGTQEGVEEEDRGDRREPEPDGAARAFEDEERQDESHEGVRGLRRADAPDQRLVIERHVERGVGPQRGQAEVVPGQPGLARALGHRIEEEAERDGEGQMDRALEDPWERSHRRCPELEGRHREGDGSCQPEGPASQFPRPEFGLSDEALGLGHPGLLLGAEPDLRCVGHVRTPPHLCPLPHGGRGILLSLAPLGRGEGEGIMFASPRRSRRPARTPPRRSAPA